ncbi:hypothetical protein AAC387_Pa06g1156 [Persea americana]
MASSQTSPASTDGDDHHHHHIVMIPYMAQGHIIPFIALAKLLEQRTHYTITFVTTPHNIPTVQSALPPNSTIRLASLPFNGSDHGLPPAAENTNTLPFPLFVPLFQASQTLQPAFDHLLSTLPRPTCIIGDVFLGWTVQTARRLGIFHVAFNITSGYGTAAYLSLWLNLPHSKTDSDTFSVPGFPDTYRLHRSQLASYLRAADGTDPWSVFMQTQMNLSLGSDGIICNTIEEMEVTGLELLRKFTELPVWCVGPLLPLHQSDSSQRTGKEPGISRESCISWLNLHPQSSVLYVSFGSMNTISVSQMMELAVGLEGSGKPFIWVVRPPLGFDVNEEFRAEWLPEGFEEGVAERKQGLVVKKWAPQLEILSHESTGAFLSQCGWNSVLESLSRGVPMIGWPMAAEQFYTAKMMEEEMGVCVEMGRGVEEMVGREKVEEVIEVVMGETEKGREMKRMATRAREIIRTAISDEEAAAAEEGGARGSSIRAVDDFIKTVRSKRGQGKD